jgi:hypothetical protein
MIEDYLRVNELPNGTRIMQPEFRLREKLEGRRLSEIFTPETIAEAEDLLLQRKKYFPDELEAVVNRMRIMSDRAFDGNQDPKIWKHLRECTFYLRNQAPIYGYRLIGKLGDMAFQHLETRGENFSAGLIRQLTTQIEKTISGGAENSGNAHITEINKEATELVY